MNPGERVTAPDPRDPPSGQRVEAEYVRAVAIAGPAEDGTAHSIAVHMVRYGDGSDGYWPAGLIAPAR
jgi:hypothetical protein